MISWRRHLVLSSLCLITLDSANTGLRFDRNLNWFIRLNLDLDFHEGFRYRWRNFGQQNSAHCSGCPIRQRLSCSSSFDLHRIGHIHHWLINESYINCAPWLFHVLWSVFSQCPLILFVNLGYSSLNCTHFTNSFLHLLVNTIHA